jgi:cytochrome c-type biogenesis protein CcmE
MRVRRTLSIAIVVLLGLGLSLTLLAQVPAQEKKTTTPAKGDRVSGMVQSIDKQTSTITVRKNNTDRFVIYSEQTKFTKQNKPASVQDLKERQRIVCMGRFDEKNRLVATRIDIRRERP